MEITPSLFVSTILGSTVVATCIGIVLTSLKEFFQKRAERSNKQFENLYGSVICILLMLKVLDINRKELIDEIKNDPISENIEDNLKRWADVNPINEEWRKNISKLKNVFENNAGYIKKDHLKLVEDLFDGLIKRDITKEGASIRTNRDRIEKVFKAIDALTDELLSK